jgi:hypothetical protein
MDSNQAAVLVAAISAVASCVTAILGVVVAHMVQAQKTVISNLEKNTNSIKDALVKVTGEEAFARGIQTAKDLHSLVSPAPGTTTTTTSVTENTAPTNQK